MNGNPRDSNGENAKRYLSNARKVFEFTERNGLQVPQSVSGNDEGRRHERPGDSRLRPFFTDPHEGPFARRGFWVSVVTLLLLIFTVFFTALQLRESIKATNAAKDAAHAACLGSQVARSTLLEYQRDAEDSHLASVASYAQALVAMHDEKTFVDADFMLPPSRAYYKPLSMVMHVKNTGKSDASNIRITGWIIIAKPNSPGVGAKVKRDDLFGIQKDSLRVGEQFPNDIPGTTKDGNPHGLYVPVLNEEGKQFIDTPELDKAVFYDDKMSVFIFYTISYEDFTARYTRKVCMPQYYRGADAPPIGGSDIDQRCSAYNSQTEVQKIPMPLRSKSPAHEFPEIDCPTTSE